MEARKKIDFDEVVRLVQGARSILLDEALLADVTVKGRANFATRCDTAVQEMLCRELSRRWPQVQFLGEEKSAQVDFSGQVWILDPVDGTANLMHHLHCSAVSLALTEGGKPVFAIVYDPFADETFTAVRGGGAFLNGRPMRVSDSDNPGEAIIAVGTSPYERELADANFALFRRVFDNCGDIRRAGTASLDLANVAAGRLEGYLERNLKQWDFAAGILLVTEAGGSVTDFAGAGIDCTRSRDVIACCAAVRPMLEAAARG